MTEENKSFFETNRDVIALIVLAAMVLFIYLQTGSFKFINFDDGFYVYENPMVMSGLNWASVKWAMTAFYAGNWHPLTWLSLQLDVQIWGPVPGTHHVVNVIFHLMSAVLAFFAFERLTGKFWESLAVAALFAVHPAHVESVAWISERKDVLSAVFWFASIWCYARWGRGEAKPWTRYYVAALVFFAIGLTAKPMVITLPFVLILCDIWPLGRSGEGKPADYLRLAVEKAPFFALSIASAVVTVMAQRTAEAVQSLGQLPIGLRVENAAISYAKYVLMAFWPAKLAVWYPYDKDPGIAAIGGAAVFLICVTGVCIWQFSKRKYLLVGWLWFVGTLVPVIGLVQVGSQSMADRYTYIPYFGLFIMIVFGAVNLFEYIGLDRRMMLAAGMVVVAVLAALAMIQTRYWADNETLYTRTLAVTKDNFLISQNLGAHLITAGRYDEAEVNCQASLAAAPGYYPAINGLGMIQFGRKNFYLAETEFSRAIESDPLIVGTYSNLALAQLAQGRTLDAETTLQKASTVVDPHTATDAFIPVLRALVAAFAEQRNYQKVAENISRILFLTPDDNNARIALADTFLKLGRLEDAQTQIETVLNAQSESPDAYNILGSILLERGHQPEAVRAFEIAIQLRPDFPAARENLTRAKAAK